MGWSDTGCGDVCRREIVARAKKSKVTVYLWSCNSNHPSRKRQVGDQIMNTFFFFIALHSDTK